MGNLKDKKGFTLVELLAVIVILGIVTVIGVTTVLPYMNKAQQDGFKDEANYVLDAATNAISLIKLQQITKAEKTGGGYCFTLKELVDWGLWTKDAKAIKANTGSTGNYEGKVVADENGKGYTYTIYMTDGHFYVGKAGGQISVDDIKSKSTEVTGWSVTCS
jgi:prepilin-type N-terminal cleavage/methylation domain-containing protein